MQKELIINIVKEPNYGATISRSMLISGDIISCEPIVVYGRVSGDITSQKSVIIHRGATVGGKIKAQEVRVDGILEGAIEEKMGL